MQSNTEVFHQPLKTQRVIFDYLYEQLVMFDLNIIRSENKTHFEVAFSNYLSLVQQYKDVYTNDIDVLFKRTEHFFMYVRNTVKGKGQKMQFYIMIYFYYHFFQDRCVNFLQKSFANEYFGSYCDFKYLCEYIYNKTTNKKHPLIQLLVKLHVSLLFKNSDIHFLCKWVPREKTKFKWLNHNLIIHIRNNIFDRLESK